MKKLFWIFALVAITLTSCGESFDDSSIWDKLNEYGEAIKDHENRIKALEELCKQMNTNISSLQTIVTALQNNDYITGVTPVTKNGDVIGYTITFAKSQPITIYHGEDGTDGYTPIIGVQQDSEGVFYWTLDGEWLLDANGNKIKAEGSDGKNGENGENGENGTTPQLKIENDYWYVTYDNGKTWTQLGKATGEDGKDSAIITVKDNASEVVFTLADGSTITIPKGNSEAEKSNNKIYYTTSDGKKLYPYSTEPAEWGAILISNVYENGQGILTFDDAVTSIGDDAFRGCSSLTSVTIPDSVTSIEKYAFSGCSSLTSVTIPDSVTKIEAGAFAGCTSLSAFGGKFVSSDSRCLIVDGVLCAFAPVGLDEYTIPDSVTSIGEWVFYDCSSLTSVTIPDSVTEIGYDAFSNCSNLTSVTIGKGVTSIGDCIFEDCTSLREVYCKPINPPTLNYWMNNNESNYKIYVPLESYDAYINAEYWRYHTKNIVAYDFATNEEYFMGAPKISAVADIDGVTLEGGVVTVTVTSESPWTAEINASDVTISKASGNGNATVTLTVPASTAARVIKVTFTAIGYVAGVKVSASADISIFQSTTGAPMISSVTPEAVGSGAEFSFKGVTVVATGSKAYVIADESGAMVVYHSDHGRTVGEKINISGQVTIYTSTSGSAYTPQFSSSAIVEVVSTGNEVTHNPVAVSGAEFDALTNNKVAKEVEFVGTWSVSGNYVSITNIDGASMIGSIQYIDNSLYSSLAGQDVVIKGYYVGVSVSGSTNYVNILPYSVELDPNSPQLETDKTKINFAATDGSSNSQTITVITNNLAGYELSWSIDNETDFTLGKQTAGNSYTVLYVYPKATNEGSIKTANILITYTNGTKTITKSVKVVQMSTNGGIAEFDFATIYSDLARGTEVGTKTVDGITLTWDKGGNINAAKWYEDCVRAYATNTFTLSGATITKVDITYISYTDPNTVSANVGTYVDGVLSGVWTGSANEVVFTIDKKDPNATSTSGQRRISKIVVTYAQ